MFGGILSKITMKEQNKELELKIKSLNAIISVLKKENESLKKENESLKKENESLDRENSLYRVYGGD